MSTYTFGIQNLTDSNGNVVGSTDALGNVTLLPYKTSRPSPRSALPATTPAVSLPFLKAITPIASNLNSTVETWAGNTCEKNVLMSNGTIFTWMARAAGVGGIPNAYVTLVKIAPDKTVTELTNIVTDYWHVIMLRNPSCDKLHVITLEGISYQSLMNVRTYDTNGVQIGQTYTLPGNFTSHISTNGSYFRGGIGEDGQICLVSSYKTATQFPSWTTTSWETQTQDFAKLFQWGQWNDEFSTWTWDLPVKMGNGPRTAYDNVFVNKGTVTLISVNNSAAEDVGGPLPTSGPTGTQGNLYGMSQVMGFIHRRADNYFVEKPLTPNIKWRLPANTLVTAIGADYPVSRVYHAMQAMDGTIWFTYYFNKPQIYTDPINGGALSSSFITQIRIARVSPELNVISDNNVPVLATSGQHTLYQMANGKMYCIRVNDGGTFSQFHVLNVSIASNGVDVVVQAPDYGVLNDHTRGTSLNVADYPLVGSLGLGSQVATFSGGPTTAPYRGFSNNLIVPDAWNGSVRTTNTIYGFLSRRGLDFGSGNSTSSTTHRLELLEITVPV